MILEHSLHSMRIDAELCRHQCSDTNWPIDPTVSFFPRQSKHERHGARTIHELAFHALQSKPGKMRLCNLVSGARLNEGYASARGQSLLFESFSNRSKSRFRNWFQMSGLFLLAARIGALIPSSICFDRINRSIGFKRNTSRFTRSQHCNMADTAVARISANGNSHDPQASKKMFEFCAYQLGFPLN
jgi:hypothetical protein